MEELWHSILKFTEQFVIPDWGELIGLLPLGLLGLILLWLAWTIRRFATIGPARRAPSRVTPVAPEGIHMPGPSYAPVLAALGAAALMWGLVVGGTALLIGVTVLALTLLWWGREAVRDYDHATHAEASSLPAVVHPGPPPGVHMPGPSFRPLLGAIGTTALMFGLVFGGWVAAAGVLILIWTLIGWLVDARAEYRQTVLADQTGHLENIPPPRWPTSFFQVGGVIFVLAVLLQAGILPPKVPTTAGGGEPGASPTPAPEPKTAWTMTAKDIKFDLAAIVVPADTPFTIDFKNEDPPGVTHDVDVRETDRTTVIQDQDVVNGGAATTYQYEGLPAGTYDFVCSIHSNMTGTITSQ